MSDDKTTNSLLAKVEIADRVGNQIIEKTPSIEINKKAMFAPGAEGRAAKISDRVAVAENSDLEEDKGEDR